MTYQPPTRPQAGNALTMATDVGVKWPKGLAAALKALDIAAEHDQHARAMSEVGRKDLDEEWLANKAEHDIAEAAKKAPEDFDPYRAPRPDVGALQDLAAIYGRKHRQAKRAVDVEASDYAALFKLLDEAWRKLPAVDEDLMTVSEAAGVQAQRDAGRAILRQANLAIAQASGITDQDRKDLRQAAKKDPERLPDLDKLIARQQGTTPEAVERERASQAKAEAARQAVIEEAAANARARNPQPVEAA